MKQREKLSFHEANIIVSKSCSIFVYLKKIKRKLCNGFNFIKLKRALIFSAEHKMNSILHSFSKYPLHQTVYDDSLFSKNLSYRCSTCFYTFIIHKSSYSVMVATCCIAIAYLYYVTLFIRCEGLLNLCQQIYKFEANPCHTGAGYSL